MWIFLRPKTAVKKYKNSQVIKFTSSLTSTMNIDFENLFNKSISRQPAGHSIEFIIDSRKILGFFNSDIIEFKLQLNACVDTRFLICPLTVSMCPYHNKNEQMSALTERIELRS